MPYTDNITKPAINTSNSIKIQTAPGNKILTQTWRNQKELDRYNYINKFNVLMSEHRPINDLYNARPYILENPVGANPKRRTSLVTCAIHSAPDVLPGTANLTASSNDNTVPGNGGLYFGAILYRATATILIQGIDTIDNTGTFSYSTIRRVVDISNTSAEWRYVEAKVPFPNGINAESLYRIDILAHANSEVDNEEGYCAGYIVAEIPLINANPS